MVGGGTSGVTWYVDMGSKLQTFMVSESLYTCTLLSISCLMSIVGIGTRYIHVHVLHCIRMSTCKNV